MRISFFAVVIVIDLLLHGYFWARLFRSPGWSRPVRIAGAVGLGLLAFLVPLVRWASQSVPHAVMRPFELVAYGWLGVAFFLFLALLVSELPRLLTLPRKVLAWRRRAAAALAPRAKEPPAPTAGLADPERRRFLGSGAAAVVATAGLSSVALRDGLAEVEVREVPVKLPKLPRALDGLTIVQLTDVHVGMATIDRGFVADLVARTNRLKPDLVVITGDLVDGSVEVLGREVGPLAELRARWGSWFVTGNHEYFSGVDAWLAELERLGVRSLRNARAPIGDGGGLFDLVGIDDHSGARWSGLGGGPDLAQALRGRDPERAAVLLAHQPKAIDEAAEAGLCLQLSGHTHGGQIWPFNHLVGLTQPYVDGLHQHGERTQIYVSRGTGYWGPPMRFLAPAEITKLVLVAT